MPEGDRKDDGILESVSTKLDGVDAKNEKKTSKPKGPKKPTTLLFSYVARIFIIISSTACIIQYCIKISQTAKAKTFGWKPFQIYFIGILNLLVSTLFVITVSVPRFSSIKKWFNAKLNFTSSPFAVGFILFYMAIAQSPDDLFINKDTWNIVESTFLVINLACCVVIFIYGVHSSCSKADMYNYFASQGKALDEKFKLGI